LTLISFHTIAISPPWAQLAAPRVNPTEARRARSEAIPRASGSPVGDASLKASFRPSSHWSEQYVEPEPPLVKHEPKRVPSLDQPIAFAWSMFPEFKCQVGSGGSTRSGPPSAAGGLARAGPAEVAALATLVVATLATGVTAAGLMDEGALDRPSQPASSARTGSIHERRMGSRVG
jgi:hypothetical protein